MQKTKMIYIADDGTEFDTKTAAEAHDKLCEIITDIDIYCAGLPVGHNRSRVRNTLIGYAKYRAKLPTIAQASLFDEEGATA